ncbi:MAG: cytochrome P460 family protein [Gemmatimonadaceae bacterium]
MRASRFVAVLSVCAAVIGCTGRDQSAAADTAAVASPDTAAAAMARVDTTGEALWARLQRENYRNWPLWPGKGKLYRGQEPHGALLTTYVNTLAQDALTNGAARMSPGAIFVKENYGPDSTLMAITVMEKVQGYDAQHQDWFWAKYQPGGKVEAAGRVDMCYQCHQGAADHDGLWTLKIAKTGTKPPPMKM